jgi:hypothetical protein
LINRPAQARTVSRTGASRAVNWALV